MNENTCTLEKEMRRALLEKLEQNYLDYTASLQTLTSEQMLDKTKKSMRRRSAAGWCSAGMIFPFRRCGICCRWMIRWWRCGTYTWPLVK